MNFETWQTGLDSLNTFESDELLGETKRQRV